MKSSVIVIKPSSVLRFSKIEEPLKIINPPLEIGSPSVFESVMLLNLIGLFNNKDLKIFEFGTYLGFTATTILLNYPNGSVTSLDLPQQEFDENLENLTAHILVDGSKNDDFLKILQNKKDYVYFKYLNERLLDNIELIHINSLEYNPQSLNHEKKFNFVFIDGGHDEKTIRNDSDKAFKLIGDNSIVVWHDYGSSIHTEVTQYLDKLSHNKQLYSIIGTSLVFYTNLKLNFIV
jgi:predicted O-methyltransferase YrrM